MSADGAHSRRSLPVVDKRGQRAKAVGIIRLNSVSMSANGSQRTRLINFSFDAVSQLMCDGPHETASAPFVLPSANLRTSVARNERRGGEADAANPLLHAGRKLSGLDDQH